MIKVREAIQKEFQRPLFDDNAHRRAFERFMSTPHGRQVANLFIRLSYGAKKRGVKVGAKAVVERIRWHFMLRDRDRQEHFKINNNYTAYLARFAMEREPYLEGFFECREVQRNLSAKRMEGAFYA